MPKTPPTPPTPSYALLRRYHQRIEAMVADPECTGDLLLVGIAVARHLLNGGGTGNLHEITEPFFGDRRTGLGAASRVVSRDRRRYQMDFTGPRRCQAPMKRREGTCGRRGTATGSLVNLDTGERVLLCVCSRPEHREWYEREISANQAAARAHRPPRPPANTGGVLDRHLPEIDWAALWKALDRDWTPPPERDPQPATPRFTVLPGLGHGRDTATQDDAHLPELALVRDETEVERSELEP